jgi:hypothetical protein
LIRSASHQNSCCSSSPVSEPTTRLEWSRTALGFSLAASVAVRRGISAMVFRKAPPVGLKPVHAFHVAVSVKQLGVYLQLWPDARAG